MNDHIVPWENAYRSAELLGGSERFVLSTSGHIQALVNPPSTESRASYRMTEDGRTTLRRGWAGRASGAAAGGRTTSPGWGSAQASCGRRRRNLGSPTFKATAKAPGIYIHAT